AANRFSEGRLHKTYNSARRSAVGDRLGTALAKRGKGDVAIATARPFSGDAMTPTFRVASVALVLPLIVGCVRSPRVDTAGPTSASLSNGSPPVRPAKAPAIRTAGRRYLLNDS